ncbi:MAG TPA: HEAT repeat domain-containing protein [Blastocatellia bacterium]|nr:HEAT repeat domain-containing protein [Blastocatellia bacterium]
MKVIILLLTFLSVNVAPILISKGPEKPEASAVTAAPQRDRFIQVEGANLQAKLDAAIRQARGSSQAAKFWTAWSFDVRPGVSVDVDYHGRGGSVNVFDGTSISFDPQFETRNLGIFVLHETTGNVISRIEVYNLDRPREYSGYPVYWLGRANNEESLNYLKGQVEATADRRVGEHGVMAIALHDDPRVGGMLKQFVRDSKVEKTRSTAVFWLGQVGGEQPFLTDLARNEQETVELRKQAVFAIGVSRDKTALATLQSLYQTATPRELKKQIIFASSVNENQNDAVTFLINLASTERDQEAKKQAIFWLGQKAGERSLKALGDTVNSNDEETEVQKQAVFAISRRQKDEAVPLLIKIAKTHPKAAVRKQAIFWLGQTGDERAVAYFKELLTQ